MDEQLLDDGKLIQEYAFKSGLILEYLARRSLHSAFGTLSGINVRLEPTVGFRAKHYKSESSGQKVQFELEVDVYGEVSQRYDTIQVYGYSRSNPEKFQCEVAHNFKVITSFLIESKSQPKDGYLLCVEGVNQPKPVSQGLALFQESKIREKLMFPSLEMCAMPAIQRASFVKRKVEKNRAQLTAEGRDIFYEGEQQLGSRVDWALTARRGAILTEPGQEDEKFGASAYRVCPILLTNVPLVLLSVRNDKATLSEIPCALLRRFHPNSLDVRDNSPLNDVFVTTVDFLPEFVDRYLNCEKYCEDCLEGKAIHEFSLAENSSIASSAILPLKTE